MERLIVLLLLLSVSGAAAVAQTGSIPPPRPRRVSTKPSLPCSPRDFIQAADTGINSICSKDGSAWNDLSVGGGSGTVTSVTASGGTETTSGAAITTTGALRSAQLVDARTSTSEALLDATRGKLVTFTNGSATAVSIAQAGAAGNFPAGWFVDVKNLGAGTVTITPATSTIGGAATLVLTTGQSARIVSNATNYLVPRVGISDAQRTVLGNTSGTNTGDQDTSGFARSDTAVVTEQFDKTSSTTLADVTMDRVMNVGAGLTYTFEAVLHVSANVGGGTRFSIAGTATATNFIDSVTLLDDATNAYTITVRDTALGANDATQLGTTAGLCVIKGTILVNASGTLTVQFAQNTSNGSASSVLVGSSFTVEKVR